MLILIPFHAGDRHLAIDLLAWIDKLGGVAPGNKLMGVCWEEYAIEGLPYIRDCERIKANWQEEDASAVNSMFRQAGDYINSFKELCTEPWLWLEPDAIPLRRGWDSDLVKEWEIARKFGKQFVGTQRQAGKGVAHLSGVAIYPGNLPEVVSEKVRLVDRFPPFDMAGGSEVLSKSHLTTLIVQQHKHPGFTSYAKLEPFMDAAVFHSNKDGSIIRLLGGFSNGAISAPVSFVSSKKEEAVLQWPVEMANAPFEETQVISPDIIKSEAWAMEILKSEASKSPLHKARLAKRLVAAGVIAEPKAKLHPKSRKQQPSAR